MKSTYIPCVKGVMGDWVYYTTVMAVADAVKYVKFAEEVCPNTDLDMMIQREVGQRSEQIASYLRTNDQRFFGALIVAAYDGKPRFLPISFEGSNIVRMSGDVGILEFDGSEQYYAVDGQHRLAALKMEAARDPERYKEDQISVIVICHTKDAEGMARARRLFTTVNRYAKSTTAHLNYAMDEDDGIALVTRRLIREHPLFKLRTKILAQGANGKPKLAEGSAMGKSDKAFLMAIGTLYKCNRALLPAALAEGFSQPQQMPEFENLEAGFRDIHDRWEQLISVVSPWQQCLDPAFVVGDLRKADGGHVLVRPIGISSFVQAMGSGFETNVPLERVNATVERYSELNASPWRGVLWNPVTNKMIVSRDAESLARRLWRYLLGLEEDRERLEQSWRSHTDPRGERNDQLPEV